MLGFTFSLLAAATFALNAAAARRAVLSGTVLQGLAITVPIGLLLFGLLTIATGQLGNFLAFSAEAWLWFAAAGIVHFVIGRFCNYSSSAAIGTNLASPILQTEVLVTLVIAMFVLGESLTPLRAIGIALVMLGPSLIGNREGKSDRAAPQIASGAPVGFQPRYTEGYIYASLAALAYGLSPIFIGLGIKAGGGGAIAGGFVSYFAATLAVGLVLVVLRTDAQIRTVDGKAMRWFVFAGVMVFLSHAFRYAAMALAPVSVVTALQRLSSMFRIYFGWIINRDHEVFDASVIAATVVSMIGAIALSISTEQVLALADWPDWVVGLARMRWP